MERPTVVIISDEAEFARAVTSCWQAERNTPSFSVVNSNFCAQLQTGHFDLAITGGLRESPEVVLEILERTGKPIIYVSKLKGHLNKQSVNGHSARFRGFVQLNEIDGWTETLLVVASQILERERAKAELARLSEINDQLQREASLGRYIVEMRHSLNNALTSLLGNTELMLLDLPSMAANSLTQLETVRNMGMRINEIMQRFSSLQKEMQLIEQQNTNKRAKAASAR